MWLKDILGGKVDFLFNKLFLKIPSVPKCIGLFHSLVVPFLPENQNAHVHDIFLPSYPGLKFHGCCGIMISIPTFPLARTDPQ